MVNPYSILGVNPSSSILDIKSAFRKQAKIFHPDVFKGNINKFREIREAYSWLLQNHNQKFFHLKEETSGIKVIYPYPHVSFSYKNNQKTKHYFWCGDLLLTEKEGEEGNYSCIFKIKDFLDIPTFKFKFKLDGPVVNNEMIEINFKNISTPLKIKIKIKEYL